MTTNIKPDKFAAEIADNLPQDNPGDAPVFLQLPKEMIEIIGLEVATSGSAETAAKNGVRLGRVCALLNRVTDQRDIANAITAGSKKWKDDPKDPFRRILIDRTGHIHETIERPRILLHV